MQKVEEPISCISFSSEIILIAVYATIYLIHIEEPGNQIRLDRIELSRLGRYKR